MDLLENNYLQDLCVSQEPVSVYLLNGIRLQGLVTGFDHNTIFLSGSTKVMVYKNHVASVLPATRVASNTTI